VALISSTCHETSPKNMDEKKIKISKVEDICNTVIYSNKKRVTTNKNYSNQIHNHIFEAYKIK
jgi:hypothetical protein